MRVIDAAAAHGDGDPDRIADALADFAPRIIGVGLFTRWVWHAYRLVERLRAADPGLDVLFMSGHTDHPAVDRAADAAGHGFLQKPFTPLALAGAVRQRLDARAAPNPSAPRAPALAPR